MDTYTMNLNSITLLNLKYKLGNIWLSYEILKDFVTPYTKNSEMNIYSLFNTLRFLLNYNK